ncbi:hypothetical protein I7I51_05937 [Histoplasma capsulatum]|uniref:Uncharacterized protein n=1 Tax=Ajellomyces capsulatus TaxID=5037 RepID=A0A8A1MF22_AJECA|nr:hypothetical protein I7I51_05937 [Histoplasma capsulatum]
MNTSISGFHDQGEGLQISGTKKRRRSHSEAICKLEQPLYLDREVPNNAQTKSSDPTKKTVRSTITSVRHFPESSPIQGLLPTSHTSAITLSSSISAGSNDLAPRVDIVTTPNTKPPATCARRNWGKLRSYHDGPNLDIPQ